MFCHIQWVLNESRNCVTTVQPGECTVFFLRIQHDGKRFDGISCLRQTVLCVVSVGSHLHDGVHGKKLYRLFFLAAASAQKQAENSQHCPKGQQFILPVHAVHW